MNNKKGNTYYFPHDFSARTDPKLLNVLMDLGIAGIGAYWCVIESLYEEGGELPLSSCRNIAFSLHCETSLIESLVRDFELFENDGVKFWSKTVNARINKRMELAQKRRDAIAKRWGNTEENTNVSENDTNVSENDTIDIQRKEKKSKEKKSKENTLNNNIVLCQNSESAADGDTKQQGGIKKIDVEKYFFVERRMVQAERIAERFWNFNGIFDWQTTKGKVKNPMYAARSWKPAPEEEGGHACTDKSLASKYFDFVKKVEASHPDGAKLLMYFNNISVEADGTTLTYNDSTAADILDTILINNQETVFKEFRAYFNAKTINYIIAE